MRDGEVQVFILCAGKGERLLPYTDLIPKPMISVANKPCLRRIIERLKRYDLVDDVIICVNKQNYPIIKDYFDDGKRFGANIRYSVSPKPLGTYGEILYAKKTILMKEDFLVYYGDELTTINLHILIEEHRKKNNLVTLALIKSFPLTVGVVELNKQRVVGFEEKPKINAPIWVGIAVLSSEIFNVQFNHKRPDFSKHVFKEILRVKKPIGCVVFNEEWYDIGTISRLKVVDKTLRRIESKI